MDLLLAKTILDIAESPSSPVKLQLSYSKLPNRPRGMGWCYTASEVYWYLTGSELKVKRAMADLSPTNISLPGSKYASKTLRHYWLEDEKGRIIDVTACQFEEMGIEPPYAQGKGCAFLTKAPSHRCMGLMLPVIKALKGELDMQGDPIYRRPIGTLPAKGKSITEEAMGLKSFASKYALDDWQDIYGNTLKDIG